MLIEELKNSFFTYQKGRSHGHFKKYQHNVMCSIDLKEHKEWMKGQLKKNFALQVTIFLCQ